MNESSSQQTLTGGWPTDTVRSDTLVSWESVSCPDLCLLQGPPPLFRGSLSFSPGHRAVLGSRCAGGSRSLGIDLLWKFADFLEGTWDSGQWAWGPWNNSTLHLQDGYFCYIHILSLFRNFVFLLFTFWHIV